MRRFIGLAVVGLVVSSLGPVAAATPTPCESLVLSLSWSPSWCATKAGQRDEDQCGSGKKFGFIVHGLWPQYARGEKPDQCPDAKLGLPFTPALHKRRDKPPQKEMQNSVQQLRNVLNAFQVTEAPALEPPGAEITTPGLTRIFQQLARRVTSTLGVAPALPSVPVLLVDDMVDSGWTLTLVAVLLQRQGSGPVYPFALAKASPRGR